MILITGAAGFIGSYLVGKLNDKGVYDLILCDDFSSDLKRNNWIQKKFHKLIERRSVFSEIHNLAPSLEAIIHLGARTDTTSADQVIFQELNLEYSQKLWEFCCLHKIPFIYASSAATYGDGSRGFSDKTHPADLKPLNPYAWSKNEFDKWALNQTKSPPMWVGLKFFNVFGPNEYHKGRMASVIFHGYQQIVQSGKMRLFRSHRQDVSDGHQSRDFIYVDDVAEIIYYLFKNCNNLPIRSGLLNIGTGRARTFLDLGAALFNALQLTRNIEFIDTPFEIRNNYQYFTCADLEKFETLGYKNPFTGLEEAVSQYLKNFLIKGLYY